MIAEQVQMSGDAYWWLSDKQEPIDPDNLKEADEIKVRYEPLGFVPELAEPIKGTDQVLATLSIIQEAEIEGRRIVYAVLSDKKIFMQETADCESSIVKDLVPIGDAYFARYTHNRLFNVCKINEYEKFFQ